jgi:flagellar protein FlaG
MPITPLNLPAQQATVQPINPSVAVSPPLEVAPAAKVKDARLQPDDQELGQALRGLNEKLQAWSTNLRFEVDDDTSRVVVQVVDAATGEVVRQIPSEEVLNMSKALGKLQDLAFRTSA